MPTLHVQSSSADELQDIANSLWKARKVVVITGAGISTNSGIPDFRSENGLYSMIQGQFDAATKLDVSKPQEPTTDEGREHDERPNKRRKASPPAEGSINVVDLDDAQRSKTSGRTESVEAAKPGAEQASPAMKNNTICVTNSSQNGSLPQPTAQTKPIDPGHENEEDGNSPSGPDRHSVSDNSIVARSLPDSNITVCTGSSRTEIEAPGPPGNVKDFETGAQRNLRPEIELVSFSSSSRRPSPTPGSSQGPRSGERIVHLPRGSRILHPLSPRHFADSGLSTPKPSHSETQTNTSSSPLSSPPPELFDPFDERSTEPPPSSSRPSSPVSDDERQSNGSDEDSPELPQERFNRSQTLRRSLSTLKGRELFDASIWADPLKTSVFYTFATNLRQKSKDAVPTGCHEFISHLSSAGKMVRCYTQNIDLLEDKVGLSTRLLLGPGSRSRFSTRLSKGATGTATPRNPNSANSPPSSAVDGPPVSSQTSVAPEHIVKEEGKLSAAASQENSQAIPLSLTTNAESDKQGEMSNPREAIGDSNEPGRDTVADQDQRVDTSKRVMDFPPAETATSNPSQSKAKPESGQAMPVIDKGVECVFLHGSLRSLRCFQCGCIADWDEGNREDLTLSGEQPPCPRCEDATAARQERGKRALGVGKLRPDIVLYGEEHPESQRISTIIQHDISLCPDMLIIMGTSLKVHGLKTVVREFAKAVHNKKDGKVIFINFTKPAESVWADIIDFWIQMDCDAWVQDLKEKKPILWLPPGSLDEEPRSTKRRRTIKDESDKKQSKKAKNNEQLEGVTQSADAPGKEDKKKLPKVSVGEKTSDVKKPEPKRPACFRDCRQNAAHLTIKIVSDLAKVSGRKEQPFVNPRFFKPMSAPPNDQPAIIPNPSAIQEPTQPQQSAKVRRGPRTKNIKSRRTLGNSSAKTSKIRTKSSKKNDVSNSLVADTSIESTSSSLPGVSPDAQSKSCADSAMSTATAGAGSTVVNSVANDASDATMMVEIPIPNMGPEPGMAGPGTSILASVKSNPRIRKPKRMFGEPVPETTSMPTSGNSKSKVGSAPQPRKTKSNGNSEKGKEGQGPEAIEKKTIGSKDPTHPLPALSTHLQPAYATSPRETPLKSYYVLPPLQQANIQRQTKHNLPALNLGSNSAAHTGHPPPDILEPIVIPGPPPPTISPTALSPHHWRNRAFQYGDPLSRHFDNHYPQGRPLGSMDDTPSHSSMSGYQQQRRWTIHVVNPPQVADVSDPSLMGASGFKFDDSPSQQLHRESRENEAAAALNDLRSQPGYDRRQFAIKP